MKVSANSAEITVSTFYDSNCLNNMACSWLVFILVHLFLDIEEIYGCDRKYLV